MSLSHQYAQSFCRTSEGGDKEKSIAQELETLRAEHSTMEKKLKATLRDLRDEMTERDELEDENATLVRRVNTLEKQLKDKAKECLEESKERDKLDTLVSELERKSSQFFVKITETERSQGSIIKENATLRKRNEELEKQILEISENTQRDMEKMKDDLRHAISAHRTAMSKIEEERDDSTRQVSILTRQLSTGASSRSSQSLIQDEEMKSLTKKLSESQQVIKAQEEKLQEANEKITGLEEGIKQARSDVKKLEEEKNALENSLSASKETEQLKEQNAILESKIFRLGSEKKELQDSLTDSEEMIQQLKSQQDNMEKELTESKAESLQLNESLIQMTQSKMRFEVELKEAKTSCASKADQEEKIKKLQTSLQEQERKSFELTKQNKFLEIEVEDLKENLEISEKTLAVKTKALTAKMNSLSEEIEDIEEERDKYMKMVKLLKETISELEDENSDLEEENTKLKKSSKPSADGISSKEDLEKEKKKTDELQKQIRDIKSEREKIQEELDTTNKKMKIFELQEARMKSLEEEKEEFSKQVKSLKEENKSLSSKMESSKSQSSEFEAQLKKAEENWKYSLEALSKSKQEEIDALRKKYDQERQISSQVEHLKSELEKVSSENLDLKSIIENKLQNQGEKITLDSSYKSQDSLLVAPSRVSGPSGRRAPTTKKLPSSLEGAVSVFPTMAGFPTQSPSRTIKTSFSSSSSGQETHKNRLIMIKGRRRPRSVVVECTRSSLNSGDVFILEMEEIIFVWNGSKSNRLERAKGVDISAKLNRSKGGRIKVITMDEGDDGNENSSKFWSELGGIGEIKSAEGGGDDAAFEEEQNRINTLYQISENESLIKIETNCLTYEMISPDECYILDCIGEIYLAIGKTSSPAKRSAANESVQTLFNAVKDSRPDFCEIVRCNAGGEPCLFCERFVGWPEDATLGVQASRTRAPSQGLSPQPQSALSPRPSENSAVDIAESMILAEPPQWMITDDVDDASGDVDIWKIVGAGKVEIPREVNGLFYSAHCYVILYTYGVAGDRSYILYFWQGRDCSKNDAGTAAAIALNMSKQYRGASQCRVAQLSEPKHFLKIFKGKLVIFNGNDSAAPKKQRLFQVRGTEDENTSTVEIDLDSKFFNSSDCFISSSDNSLTVWNGSCSSPFAQSIAKYAASMIQPDRSAIFTSESETKPNTLVASASADYASQDKVHPGCKATFFMFTTKTGQLTGEKFFHYSQKDLASDQMFLLDAFNTVYLWVGLKAKEQWKKSALEITMAYCDSMEKRESSRGKISRIQIREGSEPIGFTAFFHAWRDGEKRAEALPPVTIESALSEYHKFYSLEQLKKKDLPPTVDRANLENYLSPEDFQVAFGMSRDQFNALPKWQQVPKKKSAGLF
eukprot:TRINITY_DN22656_c0_g1_i1.p1 TRINITY_DN22656_c0_g1~~TRINITY_DN22656_c0_g1_i1.p1  ORF type:complete len:1378 (+),score=521.29 TRINITY_DN22656_c0_g1_i1:111-4244(+)